MVEDSWSQQMLNIEIKYKTFFLHDITQLNVLYMMNMKSIVSSLEKLHSGSNPDDDTLNK